MGFEDLGIAFPDKKNKPGFLIKIFYLGSKNHKDYY